MLSAERIRDLLSKAATSPDKGIGCCPSPIGICEEQIGAASLDIRLGRWFLVVQQSKRSIIDLAKNDPAGIEEIDGKYYYIPFQENFIVHPGRFVLAATLEWLRFPQNIGGYITGKSSLGRRGLVIETAAGVQPGFCGTLTLEIVNVGEVPIAITPGMRIAQLFFHELRGEEGVKTSRYSGRRKPIFGQYEIDVEQTSTLQSNKLL
ncbi:dCTP deaminase [Mesorhizobium sp. LHD-90]|uniref:dCTP deaminase n=1 Tax=Mesorhizobium sp. LHD-90 TaxID=3071414 RepID=UPI0027E1856C|nr:dCTP deaminase [Mesorhizobium sp. LHD-90]MDQ6436146.1 dCTP deaminase [Mesorhizobium sp. LHD-90]